MLSRSLCVDARSTELLAKLRGALEQKPVTEFLELLSTAESLSVAWLHLGTVREFVLKLQRSIVFL